MAEYDINATAAAEAAALLRDLLQTAIPGGDFTEGSAISDLLIDGHAIITGFLRQQIQNARNRQSLITLRYLPESESTSDAADAILDNFFRTRAQGKFAKGVATLYFSQRGDVLIPRTTRFFKSSSLVFYIDSGADLLIPATDLRAVIGPNGVVTGYSTTVFMTAARVGADYNIAPGRFVSFDRFNPLLTYVENLSAFSGGESTQTTQDFINRSTSAIALRALINARSNDATLLEQFTDIERTLTVGYGDPEMMRDLVANVSNTVAMHVGGHMDIYVRQPVQQVVEQLVINTLTPRNDDAVIMFRHLNRVPTFVAAGVVPGDVLVITSTTPVGSLPVFQYVITAVSDYQLQVSTKTPFPLPTDEAATAISIAYTVGDNYPDFDNKIVELGPLADARTSRQFSQFNSVILPARPTYIIRDVELLPPIPPQLAGYVDITSGGVNFTARKNAAPTTAPVAGEELGYFISVQNPTQSQSVNAVATLEVGWPAIDLSGLSLQVTYETPTNFEAVDAYIGDRLNRPGCSNTLAKAYHPIYLFASIPYRLRTSPASALETTVPEFNPLLAEQALQEAVNNYQGADRLDVSLLSSAARATSTAVASIYNFPLTYQLIIPDGSVMTFETQDEITIFPDGATSTAALLNPTDFGLPATGYYSALRQFLLNQGVSDRVTRYCASDGALVFVQRS
jgi:hypothetical protein